MADVISRLKLESGEWDSKIKRAVGGLQQMESECRKVGGTLSVLEKDQLEYVKALGRMETVSRSARGKLSELKEAFTELSVQYNRLTDEEKKGDFGKALSSSLEQLKTRIGESKNELDSIGKSLGDAGKQSQQTGGFMDELAKRFTLNLDVMKMFNVGLKAAETALKVAKDAFFASEANVDEWGRTVQAAQSVYEGFLTAINNGDVSGFLTRIDEIVVAARKAYNELDTLGTMKTIQAPAMSKQEAENQRIRTMLMTGRWISAADGRKSANGLKDGDLLSKAQLQQLERQLQSGMQNIVSMTKNEVKQTGRAIDAYYNSLAKNNGMSLAEFRQGTSSWAEFSKRIKGSGDYEKFENEHTSLVRQFNPIMGEYEYKSVRDNVKNPYQKYANWDTFRVDKMGKNSYNELVGLIRQQQQQQQQMYSTMGQAYRTVNRVEGITPRGIMGGNGGGSGSGGSTGGKPEVWAPIAMQETSLAGIGLHSIADVDKAIKKQQGRLANTDSYFERMDAQTEIEKLEREKAFMLPNMNPFQDAFKHNFAKDLKNRDKDEDKEGKDESEKYEANVLEEAGKMVQGMQAITSGVEQLGIDLPQSIQNVTNGITSIISIISGIATILTAIQTIQTAQTFKFWSRGGVVHAAGGMVVPGNHYSGDLIPSMIQSGEVVLNKAQAGVLAHELEGPKNNAMRLETYVSGRDLKIVLNNDSEARGQGRFVTKVGG